MRGEGPQIVSDSRRPSLPADAPLLAEVLRTRSTWRQGGVRIPLSSGIALETAERLAATCDRSPGPTSRQGLVMIPATRQTDVIVSSVSAKHLTVSAASA